MAVAKERALLNPIFDPSSLPRSSLRLNNNHGFLQHETLPNPSIISSFMPVASSFSAQEGHPAAHPRTTILRFEQGHDDREDFMGWFDAMHHVNHHHHQHHHLGSTGYEATCYKVMSDQEMNGKVRGMHKRVNMDCGDNNRKKAKTKMQGSSKDPQSIAAKNRREKISERLKILQTLIPNGSKVDLVTMLEKAISYVKFLQLQVKVLATDEFWPAQAEKAHEAAQVKEAIDSILSSHREKNFSSNYAKSSWNHA